MSRSNYQTVLITGGAGGLGKQMARQWANLGATIVLWDRDEAGLAAARDFILQREPLQYTRIPATLPTVMQFAQLASRCSKRSDPLMSW